MRKARRIRKRSKRYGKYIRRTGRKRNPIRRAKVSKIRFSKAVMPLNRGPYTKASELKYVWSTQVDNDNPMGIPYYNGALYNSYTILVADPNNYTIAQNATRTSFIGQKINLVSIDVYFEIGIHFQWLPNAPDPIWVNWPQTDPEWLVFNSNQANWAPTIRVTTLRDKKGKSAVADSPDAAGQPDPDYGFQSPYDITTWKVLEEKYYKLKPCFSSTQVQAGSMVPKTVLYFKKSFPLRMTADMDDVGGGAFLVNTMKHIYMSISTDAPWRKTAGPAGARLFYIYIKNVHGRLWYKDP